MAKKQALLVVTSNAQLGNTGGATGSWLEELASIYYGLKDAGVEVVIASPKGGKAPLDSASLEEPWITVTGKRFLADTTAMAQLSRSVPLNSVVPDEVDAVVVIGGAGAAWDLPPDPVLAQIIEKLNRSKRIVSGVCHGVLGLIGAKAPDGRLLVAERAITGVSCEEERMIGYDKIVPMIPEQRLTELGARYSCAAQAFGAHVVQDGNIVTGQNPASAPPLAQKLASMLQD